MWTPWQLVTCFRTTENQNINIYLLVCLVKVSSSEQYFLIPWGGFSISLAIAAVPPNDTWHLSCNQLMRGHPESNYHHTFVCFLVKVSSSEQYFPILWESFRISLAIAVVLLNDTRHLSRNQLMRGHPDKWSQPLTHAGHHFKWVTLQHQAPQKKRRRGWVKNLWLKGLLLSKSVFGHYFIQIWIWRNFKTELFWHDYNI